MPFQLPKLVESVLVQRQLEKVGRGVKEWAG
jgi:hypothetical protein